MTDATETQAVTRLGLYRAAELMPDTAAGRAGRLVRLCLGHVDVALNLIRASYHHKSLETSLHAEAQVLLGLGGMVTHRAEIERLLCAAVANHDASDIDYLLSLTEEAAEGLQHDHVLPKIQHAADGYEAASWTLRYKPDLQGARVFLAHIGWNTPAIVRARELVQQLSS